jgi:hypothetical protein
LVAIALLLKDEAPLQVVLAAPEYFAANIKAQLERHVETIVFTLPARLQPRKIVDRIARQLDELDDPSEFEESLSRVPQAQFLAGIQDR